MKSILYVGAALMIGASIYGFVDYTQTKQKKEFKKMYSEKEKPVPVILKKQELTTPVVQKEVVTTSYAKEAPITLTKKTVETKSSKMSAVTTTKKAEIKTNDNPVKEVVKKEQPPKVKLEIKKKKRKISAKIFSRAPLDDEYEVDEIEDAPVKTSTEKTVVVKTVKD
ncbi:MAG TPA: hypothetical protein PLG88_04460 [Chitinophagaceae bacterium]|nr:hypothetical protein [Chitinophagaceae bacterium]